MTQPGPKAPRASEADQDKSSQRPEVAMPPAPPGELPAAPVEKTRAVAEAATRLGSEAGPQELAEDVRERQGLDIQQAEVAAINQQLHERAEPTSRPGQSFPGSSLRVRDVMTRDVETVAPHSTLVEAAARMKTLGVGVLPVCEGDQLVGMLTDRDITVRATAHGHDPVAERVRDVMTRDLVSCREDQDVAEAARLMQQKQLRRLVVLDQQQRLVGIVSLDDLAVRAGTEHLAGETLKRVAEPDAPGQ
jgi:CBS domain-containing protein